MTITNNDILKAIIRGYDSIPVRIKELPMDKDLVFAIYESVVGLIKKNKDCEFCGCDNYLPEELTKENIFDAVQKRAEETFREWK